MTTLAYDVLAKDAASAVFKNVGKSVDDMNGHIKRANTALANTAKVAALAVGGAALGGLFAVIRTGIGEQSDFLKGQAQLAAGIKSTGGAAGVSVSHLEDLASSIQNYSGQTDDSIVASEKLLLTFTGIRNAAGKGNDIFDQATKATADLAARMGGDASGAAIQLGKALNDPVKGITALTRIGVSFSDGQKAQIAAMVKTGNTMGAQKVILAELNKEFGGSAKAAGDTLPGQMARAKRAFEDVSQSVVAALLPALLKGADLLEKYFVPALQKTVSWVTQHWPQIQSVIVGGWNKYVMPALRMFGTFMSGVIIPAVQAVVSYVVAHWPQIQAAFVTAWQAIKPTVDAFMGALMALWNSVLIPLTGWVVANWPTISAVIRVALIAVAIAVKVTLVGFQLFFNVVKVGILVVAAVVQVAFAYMVGIFNAAKLVVVTVIAVWVAEFNLAKAAVNVLMAVVGAALSGVRAAFNLASAVVRVQINLMLAAARLLQAGISAAASAVAGAVGWIGGAFANAYSTVSGYVSQIVGVVAGLPGKVASIAGSMYNAGASLITALGNGVSSAVGGALNFGSDLAHKLSSALGLPHTFGGQHVSLGPLGGFDLPSVTIPGFALGGATPANAPYWVGERGPELMFGNRSQYVATNRQSEKIANSTSAPASNGPMAITGTLHITGIGDAVLTGFADVASSLGYGRTNY